MNYRQVLFRNSRITPFRDHLVGIPEFGEICVPGPIVGNDLRARCDGLFNKAAYRFGGALRNDREPDPSGAESIPARVAVDPWSTSTDLGSGSNQRLVVDAANFATPASANPCFIDFDMLVCATSDPVMGRAQHTGAQLM
jgi:hypothetical protein